MGMRLFSIAAARFAAATMTGATLLLLVSCAPPGPTGYRPLTGKFGYTVDRVDESTWRVVYYANPETPGARVEEFALYRAAQLAREQGKSQFAVMEKDFGREEERRSIREAPPPGFEQGGSGYGVNTTISRTPDNIGLGSDDVSVRLRAELVVRPYEGAPPADAMRLYATERTLDSLAPVVERASQ